MDVPVKQLLRWQDDGGALAPGAPAHSVATAPESTTATAQLAP
jgi:hypothetical protein